METDSIAVSTEVDAPGIAGPMSTFAADSFAERLRAARRNLTRTESRVGTFFLAHPEAALASITEVVESSGLGYGTIVRFCKKLGFAGFQDFKLCLAVDRRDPANGKPASPRRLIQQLRGDLDVAAQMLTDDDLDRAAALLAQAENVLIGGVASSASVAVSLEWKLTWLGLQAFATSDSYLLAVRAAMLDPGDVCVAISASGATKEMVRAVGMAKKRGAAVVLISSFARSPVARHAGLVLSYGSGRDPVDAETPSTIASEAVVELLFQAVRGKLESLRRTTTAGSPRKK